MNSTQNKMKITIEEEEEEAAACNHAMQLASASVLPMVLKAAIELDVFEIIAKVGQGAYVTPNEIVSQQSTNNIDAPIMLDRMLRLLASYKVLTCTLRTLESGRIERLYGLAPVCKFLVKNEDGVSIAPLVLMNQDKILMESWYHLKDSVIEGGIPFNKAYGMSLFVYHGIDSRFSMVFNKGMADHSTITMKKMFQLYKGFDGLKSLVDVGGGIGATVTMIVSEYPMIKGINFDLAHVIEDAPSYPGVEHIGGDMFVSIPHGDAIFMKWILHDWSDERNLEILKNCYKALPEDGKVIIVESILPMFPETNLTAKNVFGVDNIMLAHSPRGKERTGNEYEALAKGAGFDGFRIVCGAYNTWLMEFCKKN